MTIPSTLSVTYTASMPMTAVDVLAFKNIADAVGAAAAVPTSTGSSTSPSAGMDTGSANGGSEGTGSALTSSPSSPLGGTSGGSSSSSSGTPAQTAPVIDAITAKYFPADPASAAFPSPENSRIIDLNGTISGRPYLLDSDGKVHQLVKPSDAVPNGYTVNGAWAQGGGSNSLADPGSAIAQLLVRQGHVYAERSSGQWQLFASNGSLYGATLVDPFVTDSSGASTGAVAPSTVKAPPLPARQSPAPGSSGKVLTVGAGKAYATISAAIAAAEAGDTVQVDPGTYKEPPPAWTVPLFLNCDGGVALIDCTGLTGSLARGKGALVPCADTHIRNIHVTGVAMDQTTAQLTSGVRPDGGCGYLLLENVELYGNQSGLGTGDDFVCEVTVSGGDFHDNGLNGGDDHSRGYTHNIYTGRNTSLILKDGFSSYSPNGGHAVKHRGFAFSCTSTGRFDATEAAVFDIPDGTVEQAVIDGAQITKPAASPNHAVIDYATDDAGSGNGGLLIRNATINALCDSPFFNVGGGSVITIDPSTKIVGTKPTATGGKVVGL